MDKIYHIVVGIGLGFIFAAILFRLIKSKDISLMISYMLVLSIGFFKELYDVYYDGTPELLDAIVTAVGGLLGGMLWSRIKFKKD